MLMNFLVTFVFRWWNSQGLWACQWGGRPCWGTQTCWPLRRRWCTWSGASAPEIRRLNFLIFLLPKSTYCWQHCAQRVELGAQLSESSTVVISYIHSNHQHPSNSLHHLKIQMITGAKPVSGVVLGVQAGEEGVISLLDRVVQRLVGHHDPLPLLVHVPPQLLEERAKEDDAVSQRVLQFPDWHQSSLKLLCPLSGWTAVITHGHGRIWERTMDMKDVVPPGYKQCPGQHSAALRPCLCP